MRDRRRGRACGSASRAARPCNPARPSRARTGVDAMVAGADERVEREPGVADRLHPADVFRIDAVIGVPGVLIERLAVSERLHSANVFGINAVIAGIDEIVQPQVAVSERREAAHVLRIHAVIAQADRFEDRAERCPSSNEAVAQLAGLLTALQVIRHRGTPVILRTTLVRADGKNARSGNGWCRTSRPRSSSSSGKCGCRLPIV